MPDGGAAFTLLTTAPGPDVAPIHDRQMIVLGREDWGLNLNKLEAALLAPLHCAVMTAEFLGFSKSCGNDLSTPMPEFGFPSLRPGDRWCLCAPRWQEALEAGQAPRVVLRATHESALDSCALTDLKRFAVDLA
jgi:hypothetical protein